MMTALTLKNMPLVVLFAFVFMLAGCESSVVKPEEAIANHPEWDEQTKAYIRQGMLLEGMTKEQVKAAWGKHCDSCQGSKKFDWGETWEYPTQVVFFDKSGKMTKFVAK